MPKKLKVLLLLASFCVLILSGALSLKAVQESCNDMGCLGDGICGTGFKTFNGCSKTSTCNGGSTVKCEAAIG